MPRNGGTDSPFRHLRKKLGETLGWKNVKMQELKEMSTDFGGELTRLLKPTFKELNSGGKNRLRISFPCDTPMLYSHVLSFYIENTLTFYMKQVSINYSFDDMEMTIEATNDQQGSIERKMHVRKKGSLDDLFTVEYHNDTVGEGRLDIDIYEKFAKEEDACMLMCGDLFREVILDNERLRDVLNVGETHRSQMSARGGEELADLGVIVYKSDATLQRIGGYESVKETIKRDLLYPLFYPDKYKAVMQKMFVYPESAASNAILFYGPPGTGKTLMARIIASEEKINMLYVNLSKMVSMWMDKMTEQMAQVFDAAQRFAESNGKTILFIDEIDSIGGKTEFNDAANLETRRLVNAFLTQLDGLLTDKENTDLILIGATNYEKSLDRALRSRFGSDAYFPLPEKADRAKIWSLYSKHLSTEEIDKLASITEGFAGRDIRDAAKLAARRVIKEQVDKKAPPSAAPLQYLLDGVETMRTKVGLSANRKVPGYS